jgi:hypothetical protein
VFHNTGQLNPAVFCFLLSIAWRLSVLKMENRVHWTVECTPIFFE